MRGFLAFILLSPFLFPLQYQKLTLRIYSSSDWTVVRFASRRIALCSRIRPDYPGLRLLPDAVLLNQPLGQSREISMEVYFYGGRPQEKLVVEKGYEGEVVVKFSSPLGRVKIKNDLHQGDINRKVFEVSFPDEEFSRDEHFLLSPKVLSFYYPWYGTPYGPSGRWIHWDLCGHRPWEGDLASAHIPLLGPYDSKDPAVIRQHILWAKMGGIDGFVLPCFGSDNSSWEGIRAFVKVAKQEGFPYALSFPFPDYPGLLSPEEGASVVKQALRIFSSPLYIKVQGKPLVFFYASNALSRSFWRRFFRLLSSSGMEVFSMGNYTDPSYGELFDGGYFYLPIFLKESSRKIQSEYFAWLRALGKLLGKPYFFPVFPGFEKTACGPGPVIPRGGGRTLTNLIPLIISLSPQWLLASTFNEWHEGTEFEPSQEYGFYYLELLSSISQEFKANAQIRR